MAGTEYHVAQNGDDSNTGGCNDPMGTIQHAADHAQPGDTITVHQGIYRERIDPPCGGTSDTERITYQAAPGEHVCIKGSEPMRGWERQEGDAWKVTIPNTFFGSFNPYAQKLRGHWFTDKGRNHHPGSVYLDGHWLLEAPSLDKLTGGSEPQWFGAVDDEATTLWAEFPDVDPNESEVEIGVRQSVFYPSKAGIGYLTVRGFELLHAATPWAPPTTEQIGLIGTNWGKGWIIENNRIAYSACAGLTLGKYDDPKDFGDRDVVEFTEGGDTYHGTIHRALAHGWSLESTGNHLVRNNQVSHCEMAGICGSLGAVRSIIEGNEVHDIHTRRQFTGHEQAGIKIHAPIDSLIRNNHIYNCPKGLWMDWMSQGTRISRNVCHDNGTGPDLYIEVNHGPCVVDNNLFLSEWSVDNASEGTLFAHNLISGKFNRRPVLNRTTPYHKPHSTEIAGFCEIKGGDDRLYHNIFKHLENLDGYGGNAGYPSIMVGNRFKGSAASAPTEVVESHMLGTTKVSEMPFTDYDGSPLAIRPNRPALK